MLRAKGGPKNALPPQSENYPGVLGVQDGQSLRWRKGGRHASILGIGEHSAGEDDDPEEE